MKGEGNLSKKDEIFFQIIQRHKHHLFIGYSPAQTPSNRDSEFGISRMHFIAQGFIS